MIIFLFLLTVGGYYVLWFFSKLAAINMFSVMAWGFRANRIGKDFPSVVLVIMAFLSHIMLFVAVYNFYTIPAQISDLKNSHAGGLLGYRDIGLQTKVYDPSQNTYIAYDYFGAPFPANKFAETFEVILLYKLYSSDYYQNTEHLGLLWNLMGLITGAVGLVWMYLSLYVLADRYIKLNNLPYELSHYYMFAQFRKIVGMPLGTALAIILSVVVFIMGSGVLSVKNLMDHYRELYASHQKTLRNELLNKISPGDTVTGVVIRRFWHQEREDYTTGESDDIGGKRTHTRYYTFLDYTIEFKNLIQIPVYLNLILPETGRHTEGIDELDRLFPDKRTVIPNEMKEFTFTVNPDYSISLMEDRKKSQE